ncbi:MAG: hypothetical protein QXM68_02180 [Candidatus Aenigmatarchaeota archaeon]|nr:hypothetical protein [Candidatus Aenigmarchaeota archaeon]
MEIELLLIANFLLFLAIALEAKIRSKTGYFIVLTGMLIGIIDLVFVLLSILR